MHIDGKTLHVPFESIDTDKVEVQCNDEGCALVLDDGNPHNDVYLGVDHVNKFSGMPIALPKHELD